MRMTPQGQNDEKALGRGYHIRNLLALTTLTIGGAEAAAYYLGALQIWESYLLTPSIPILVTIAALISDELGHEESPWKGESTSGLRRSLLMFLGALTVAVGLGIFRVALVGGLFQVTTGLGIAVGFMCFGVYIIWRFSR